MEQEGDGVTYLNNGDDAFAIQQSENGPRSGSPDRHQHRFQEESTVLELSEALQIFLLDVLSFCSGRAQIEHIYSSPFIQKSGRIDATSIFAQLTDLCSHHLEGDLSNSVIQLSDLSEEAQLSLLLSQVAAIVSNPIAVKSEQRRGVTSEIEITVLEWLKQSLGFSNAACFHIYAPPMSHFAKPDIVVFRAALYHSLDGYVQRTQRKPDISTSFPKMEYNGLTAAVYLPSDVKYAESEAYWKSLWKNATIGVEILGQSGITRMHDLIVRRIPALPVQEAIDVNALGELLNKDALVGIVPVLIVGRAGTPVTGELDPFAELRTTADQHGAWLHVHGSGLSGLLASEDANDATMNDSINSARLADSVSLDLASWFGFSAIRDPSVCFPHQNPLLRDSLLLSSMMPDEAVPIKIGKPIFGHDEAPNAVQVRATCVDSENLIVGLEALSNASSPSSAVSGSLQTTSVHSELPAMSLCKFPLEATIPYWVVMQTIGMTAMRVRAAQTRELAQSMAYKLSALPFFGLICPVEETYDIVTFRFDYADNEKFSTGRREGDVLPNDSLHDVGKATPGNMSDKATKNIFCHIPHEVKSKLGLSLVLIQGSSYISYQPSTIGLPPEFHAELLVMAITEICREGERLYSAFNLRAEFLEIIRDKRELQFWHPESIWELKPDSSDENGYWANEDENGAENVWMGLGAIRYTPAYLVQAASFLNPSGDDSEEGNPTRLAAALELLGYIDYLNERIAYELADEYGPRLFSKGGVRTPSRIERQLKGDVASVRNSISPLYEGRAYDATSPASASSVFAAAEAISRRVSFALGRPSNSPTIIAPWHTSGSPRNSQGRPKTALHVCIKLGVGKQPYDKNSVAELASIVLRKGAELERDTKFMSLIERLIRRGIQQAERELKQAHAEPSILRSIPIVGSVLSWLAPETPRPAFPVSRTFTITEGFLIMPTLRGSGGRSVEQTKASSEDDELAKHFDEPKLTQEPQ
ncbi:hypothetical protein BJ742DRAFT_796873 [Cladochytrium replicatum]|nr:hypothetical protein BJ742DRAFT_796873 [Cladochytrium replicatum]